MGYGTVKTTSVGARAKASAYEKGPYVFKCCDACKNNECRHIDKDTLHCNHADHDGDHYYKPLEFMYCDCRTEKAFLRRHDYSNKYLPRHCTNCGARAQSVSYCVPVSREMVMALVEKDIGASMAAVPERPSQIEAVRKGQPTVLFQGNVSPIRPVTWALIGGPLAQRRPDFKAPRTVAELRTRLELV
jgi:hypothetical protein